MLFGIWKLAYECIQGLACQQLQSADNRFASYSISKPHSMGFSEKKRKKKVGGGMIVDFFPSSQGSSQL